MSEIWNLSAICRCCHTDGNFKMLNLSYVYRGHVEIYSEMLSNTLNVKLPAPTLGASFTICDNCIERLRDAALFKTQILECEDKFEEYIKNELALLPVDVKVEYGYNDDNKINIKAESIITNNEQENELEIEVSELAYSDYADIELPGVGDEKPDVSADRSLRWGNAQHNQHAQKIITKKIIPIIRSNMKQKTKTKEKIEKRNKTLKKKRGIQKMESLKMKKMHTCQLCSEKFDRKLDIYYHVDKNHTRPYSCKTCGMEFVTYFLLERHIVVHADVKHTCDLCGKIYTSRVGLRNHRNVHTRANVFTCDVCKKNFLYKSTLRQHIRGHMGTLPKTICQTCGQYCNNYTELKRHITVVHQKLRLYKCTECPKTFTANKGLKIHTRLHTGETYKCDVCDKKFLDLSNLNCHKKIHRPTAGATCKLYTCKRCPMSFDHKGIYLSHTRTHVENKTLICELCGKNFSCKYSLKRHLSIHNSVRKFRCEPCGRSFTTKFQVERHVEKRHDSVTKALMPKVKCEICNKGVWNIKEHQRTHYDRRFACSYCDKTYSQGNALNRHVKEYHRYGGEKQHQCEMCSKRYRTKRNLKEHKIKSHKFEESTEREIKNL